MATSRKATGEKGKVGEQTSRAFSLYTTRANTFVLRSLACAVAKGGLVRARIYIHACTHIALCVCMCVVREKARESDREEWQCVCVRTT